MEIIELHEEFPFHKPTVRADGIHVSDCVQRIMQDIQTKQYKDDPDKEKLFALGLHWEDVLSTAFGDRLADRPDEMCLEEVYGNPDGLQWEFLKGNIRVEEYKWTFSGTPLEDMRRYHFQTKAYCYMCGVNECIFRIARIKKWPNWIDYEVKKVIYSDQEIVENWQLIQKYKTILEEERDVTTTRIQDSNQG